MFAEDTTTKPLIKNEAVRGAANAIVERSLGKAEPCGTVDSSLNVLVTGAGGKIAYHLLHMLARGDLYGNHTKVSIRMQGTSRSLSNMKGVKMEIEDCAFDNLSDISVTDDLGEASLNADVAFLLASVPRPPEATDRRSTLHGNVQIIEKAARSIEQHASPNVKVFVCCNPVNTLAGVFSRNAPTITAQQIHAVARLDLNRALYQVSQQLHCCPRDVQNLIVWGNHSPSQIADIRFLQIRTKNSSDRKNYLEEINLKSLQQITRDRGKAIILHRKTISCVSAAQAIADLVKDINTDTPMGQIKTATVMSDGSYSVPEGMFFSFPVVFKGGRYKIIDSIENDVSLQQEIQKSIDELREEELLILPSNSQS